LNPHGFNHDRMNEESLSRTDVPVVLSIGGSDSGGGAGIQADLKTYSSLGVYGTTVITCVTAQTPTEVRSIEPVSPDLVTEQIRAVSNGFPIAVAKTGMLYSAEIIERVARADVNQGIPILVVDPVMVAASGARLLQSNAIDAMKDQLLPLARVVTPNVYEAEILTGHTIASIEELKQAAREIGDRYDVACVAKGGHMDGDEVVDILYDEGEFYSFACSRVHAKETHGAGCVFSAAIASYLAHGSLLTEAVERAKEYVRHALEHALLIGHHAPMNLFNPPE
jgi:hydroxymethylpyrimidine/phosphomethylpyrimidine kinase